MRRSRTAALLLPLLALAATAGSVAAQQIPSPYRYVETTQGVQLYGGWLLTDATVSIRDDVSAAFGPQDAPLVGARYLIRLSGPIDGEVGVAFSPSERRLFTRPLAGDTLTPVDTGETAAAPLLLAEAGLRFNVTGARTWRGLQPYVGASGGLVMELGSRDPAESELSETERVDFGPGFALGLKLGADWNPSDRWTLFAEASDRLWKVEIPPAFLDAAADDDSEWTNNVGLTAGLSYRF